MLLPQILKKLTPGIGVNPQQLWLLDVNLSIREGGSASQIAFKP